MKKLLLLLPILFIFGCNREDPEQVLTVAQKQQKMEESARKYLDEIFPAYSANNTFHFNEFRTENKSLDFLKNVHENPLSLIITKEQVEENYTRINHSMSSVIDEGTSPPILFYFNENFVVITWKGLSE
jgi:hypothetical protein